MFKELKTREDQIDKLFSVLQNVESKVEIHELRQALQSSGIEQDAQIFMGKTAELQPDTKYSKKDLKKTLDLDPTHSETQRAIFQLITGGKSNEITSINLDKLNDEYKLQLSEEDIETIVKFTCSNVNKRNINFGEFRDFNSLHLNK